MARRTVRARQTKPAQGMLAEAGLQPGRGALITMAILCVLGLGLVIWHQTPASGAIAAKESEWKIVISADRHIAGDDAAGVLHGRGDGEVLKIYDDMASRYKPYVRPYGLSERE